MESSKLTASKKIATGYFQSMKNSAEAAAYLEAEMELDDPAALLVSLRHVAKVHGMAEVARRANVGDKTLFKALSENGTRL